MRTCKELVTNLRMLSTKLEFTFRIFSHIRMELTSRTYIISSGTCGYYQKAGWDFEEASKRTYVPVEKQQSLLFC